MSTVAEQLRSGREQQNLTIQQVAEITKMRTDHIRAVEEGRYDTFSAPVYIRGFVRTYATLVKLDVPGVMATLDGELVQTTKFRESPPLSQRPGGIVESLALWISQLNRSKGRLGLGVGGVIVIAFVLYLLLRPGAASDPLKSVKPGLHRAAPNAAGDTLPLPSPTPRK